MPPIPELPAGGLYVLLIRLTAVTSLRIGALGFFDLSPGWYLYIGNTRRNLPQRSARHFAPDKPPRWHIDYLIATPNAHTQGAIVHPGGGLSECELNRAVGSSPGSAGPSLDSARAIAGAAARPISPTCRKGSPCTGRLISRPDRSSSRGFACPAS